MTDGSYYIPMCDETLDAYILRQRQSLQQLETGGDNGRLRHIFHDYDDVVMIGIRGISFID